MKTPYKILFLSTLLTNSILLGQTGPGGVGDNTSNIFWLDANEIPTSTYSDGDNLDTWIDVSGNGLDLTQPTPNLTPEYKTGVLNGYPVVRFNKTIADYGRLRRTGVASFPSTAITTFIVNQNAGETNDGILSYASTADHNDFLIHNSANYDIWRVNQINSGTAMNDGNWHILDINWRSSDGDTRLWLDGTQRFSGTHRAGTAITTNGCLALANDQDAIDGAYDDAQAHLGDFAEVLIYNISLNQAQRIIVANYLAAKYNIAMAGNDYFSYEGTHSIDVAGIGRETAGEIHTAAMSDNILQVENPSNLDANKEYLLFGHDNGDITTSWTTTEAPSGGATVQRLAREWRFSETNGDVGTVDFLVDIASFPTLPAGFTKYAIMVDSDGDFTSGADVYEIGLVGGTTYDLLGINIADGDFVAIAAIDPEIAFSIDKSNGFEPNNATIDITLNYIPRTAVTVDYTTADGTALVGQPDYTGATPLTATILAGNNTGTITIPIIDDALVEPDEDFTITLSNPSAGISLGTQSVHTYIINDDDDARKIYFNLAANSGDESISSVSVNVSMNTTSATDVTVDYTVTGGTATPGAGNDFVLAAGTLTIVGGSGLSTGSFTITVNDDAIFENNETIIITLSNPTGCNLDNPGPVPASVGTGFIEHTYTIIDNDIPPVLSFNTAASSGAESVSPVSIGVFINAISQADVTATYTVSDITATGSDYIFASGTLNIPAGSTTANLLATIIDDGIEELPETFAVTLSAPVNATIATGIIVHTYTIIDNDAFGYLGPGGVGDDSNNKLWVKADAAIYSDAGTTLASSGSPAQEWHDQSGNGHDLSQPNATFRPNYIENVINNKPVMRFNVSNNRIRRLAFNDFPTSSITSITVSETSIGNDARISYAVASDNNHYLLFNSSSQTVYVDGTNINTGQAFNDGAFHILGHTWRSSDGENQLYEDGSQVYNGTISAGGSLSTGGCLAIGGEQDSQDGGYVASQDYEGDIAETIIYNTKINTAQQIIVNNYLAAKYGLTITNDKYSYEAIFGHEVAGIGREDASNVHLDAQGSAMVRINNPTGLDNGEYLIWGHNNVDPRTGAYQAPWLGETPVGVNNSLHRVWRVDEVGDVGNISIKFDVSELIIGETADLVLLIDTDDGDFANATVIPLSSFSAPYANFDGVNLGAGNWFTLGSTTTFNSLPIELISFEAQLNDHKVDITWQTASEINNDFFSVQRSQDGKKWETITVLDGTGNSSSIVDYRAEDSKPLSGTSFYRLKQTDFDGQFTYSQVETITINNSYGHEVLAYPNPTHNKVTLVSDQDEIKQIIVLNSLGQDVTKYTSIQNQNDTSCEIDLSNLSNGVYFIRTKTNVTKVSKK